MREAHYIDDSSNIYIKFIYNILLFTNIYFTCRNYLVQKGSTHPWDLMFLEEFLCPLKDFVDKTKEPSDTFTNNAGRCIGIHSYAGCPTVGLRLVLLQNKSTKPYGASQREGSLVISHFLPHDIHINAK